ncbi:molybdopterin converting factor subunit 1 [Oricola cellulosilytica]|uniref:Molybdopterin converting factor subunit 1 n=1 Tax=Oricola cellulosilytica TaxID=1429082 RepID=A0A4R0PAR5_9HYPH|nr:molybdopterin converting factor subunit 1 [Oricola cellulosilytica]TCD14320.1 molybdopterin converting factor subunit 1 [Oricola cellulosilytica]
MTKMVYFAWVRERIGLTEEEIDIPGNVKTGADLLAWMKGRGHNYEAALAFDNAIRIAVDHEHIDQKEDIGSPREIALFPPMTGG